jgi:hydrogenase-4 transcriptional activator
MGVSSGAERRDRDAFFVPVVPHATATGAAILGKSAAVRRVLAQIDMVAQTDATVLILGETGVGKELVARAIHESSARSDRSMIVVNCTAIPRELFESEFFGHIKGAFSGAFADRVGHFQMADGGTLFLDELGSLSPEMQPKLLRVLQDGRFEPVGGDKTRRVNVRILAATNRNLMGLVREGRFRQDLYYRLSVFPIKVRPLRERKDDIPILATHFLNESCKRFSRSRLHLTASQLRQLQDYDWPGNVRELENVIERAVIAARGGHLRLYVPEGYAEPEIDRSSADGSALHSSEVITEAEMKRLAHDNLVVALKRSRGRIYGPGGAAELLGIKPSTLSTRVKKLGLK